MSREIERSVEPDQRRADVRNAVAQLDPAPPRVVPRTATVADAVDLMRQANVGCVLVCDADRLVGLFTERDLMTRVLAVGKPLAHPVAEVMTPNPETVSPKDPIRLAVRKMKSGGHRHLPVVDADGRLVGLITQRDLLAAADSSLAVRRLEDRVRLLGRVAVGDVMETHVSVVAPDEAAAEAGRRMARHKIGCLPVLGEGGCLAGIVTEEDFLRWATEHMAAPIS